MSEIDGLVEMAANRRSQAALKELVCIDLLAA
jgi:hypothetical protein